LADDRFVPRDINGWRASIYMDFLVQGDLNILSTNRQTRDTLPIPRSRIDRMFRSLIEDDLRTTALGLGGVRPLPLGLNDILMSLE
jgi:hypothetical protein